MENINQKATSKWIIVKKVLIGVICVYALSAILNVLVPDEKPVEVPKTQAQIDIEKRIAANHAASEKARIEKEQADAVAWKNSSAGKLCAKYLDWSKKTCDMVSNKEIAIGMTAEQVRLSIGKPDKINTTTTANANHEQWVYGVDYVYFDEGIVTAVQQSGR
ncbi:MAG: hypothetical protein V4469_04695 [Patescibacteria group bacterium]